MQCIIVPVQRMLPLFLPGSVVDPDPYVFKPPGSVIIYYGSGSGSFYQQAKKLRKTNLDFYYFVPSFWLFYLWNGKWKLYLQKVISKKVGKNTYFLLASCQPLPVKGRIRSRIRKSVVPIRGSGSVPKCHGFHESWFSYVFVIQVGDNCGAARGFCLRTTVGSWEDFLPKVITSRKLDCLTRWIWMTRMVSFRRK